VILMSRWTKRLAPVLARSSAAWQLAFHWLDLYWNVMPNIPVGHRAPRRHAVQHGGPLSGNPLMHTVGFSAVDVTIVGGADRHPGGGIGKAMKGNLIPTRDPMLAPERSSTRSD
jgi:hypothetical protein